MTQEQIEAHEEAGESFHVPVIVHRAGGVSAKLLNTCGICGSQIQNVDGQWMAISDKDAEAIRKNKR